VDEHSTDDATGEALMKKAAEKDGGSVGFEEQLEALRAIVDRMEHGGLGLEESLKLFEEGVGAARRLFDILTRAEGRVEELLANMETIPFNRGEE
jgi:exodeoxyribonuclease VII small subunit